MACCRPAPTLIAVYTQAPEIHLRFRRCRFGASLEAPFVKLLSEAAAAAARRELEPYTCQIAGVNISFRNRPTSRRSSRVIP